MEASKKPGGRSSFLAFVVRCRSLRSLTAESKIPHSVFAHGAIRDSARPEFVVTRSVRRILAIQKGPPRAEQPLQRLAPPLDRSVDHCQEHVDLGEVVRVGREGIGREDDEVGELARLERP